MAEQTSALGQGSNLLNIVVTNPTNAFFSLLCLFVKFYLLWYTEWIFSNGGYFTLKCYIL